jgi:peptidoglycan/LPS O-acetylase OafA/YrhL
MQVAYSIDMIQTVFALTVAAAGWYYMFYSHAAERLAGVEGDDVNRRRVRLRRVNGLMMFLLGVFFFAGFFAVDLDRPTIAFFLVWLIAMVLLLAIVVLAAIDVRLTLKLKFGTGRHLP